MKRQELIKDIAEAAEAPELRRYKPAQRFEVIGNDGKTYSGGMPWGVHAVGRGAGYWVLMHASDGTTHGKRFDTKEELMAEFEGGIKRRTAEFVAQLDQMTDEQLADQAEYWLRGIAV